MKSVFVLFLAVMTGACVSKPIYYAFEENGQYGYKDKKGATVIPAQFDYAITEEMAGDIAFVTKGKDILAIDRNGRVLLTCYNYDNGPDPLEEGLFRFVENDKIGFANSKCAIVIPAQFSFVRPFKDGMAAFYENFTTEKKGEYTLMKGGQWGFINKKGEIVIPAAYEEAGDFEDGKVSVFKNRTEIVLDKKGRPVKK